MSDNASIEGPPRKKMRKGTHSCWECRRRKIRCIFTPENQTTCSECFARGSKCIDQEHAESDMVLDQRKNLRERVARLESLVDTLLEDRTDRGAAEALRELRSSKLPPTPISNGESPLGPGNQEVPGHTDQAPLLTLFNNDVVSRIAFRSYISIYLYRLCQYNLFLFSFFFSFLNYQPPPTLLQQQLFIELS